MKEELALLAVVLIAVPILEHAGVIAAVVFVMYGTVALAVLWVVWLVVLELVKMLLGRR